MEAPGYVRCDLTRPRVLDLFPDVVVHAAARSSPWGTAREFADQNVKATRHVVDFCEKHGRPHLVHISTSAVMYTEAHQLCLNETAALPAQPINRYAASKRAAEEVVGTYAGPWAVVRPRAVFGPNDTVVFPRILRAARSGRLPYLAAAEPVVGDLIYIDTLVDYLLRIVNQRITGLYLLTNNQPVPIWDFLGTVFGRLGLPVPRRRVPVERAMRAAAVVEACYRVLPFLGEPPVTRFGVSVFAYSKTFNVAKALRDLGPPSVSLDEGVERFVRWQLAQTT
jgi:2-alkyl-3-oxoalkanoate reductase